MADKKVYRRVKDGAGNVVSLFDSWSSKFIPVDADNADYQKHLLLISQSKALLLDAGESLPAGVTDADVQPSLPKLGIESSSPQ